jgi:hypothetical protein
VCSACSLQAAPNASDLELRSREALTVYIARLEQLLKACWPAALKGDLRAIEAARKVLAQQAKLFGLEDHVGAVPPMAEELDDEEDDFADELAAYRTQHRGGARIDGSTPSDPGS